MNLAQLIDQYHRLRQELAAQRATQCRDDNRIVSLSAQLRATERAMDELREQLVLKAA